VKGEFGEMEVVAVVGGGVTGSEYACTFGALTSQARPG
jgi:pyruvate/2-oxoglutarate dehydrogenase complex dihydrolipoamide dehydrogenase (E3) component